MSSTIELPSPPSNVFYSSKYRPLLKSFLNLHQFISQNIDHCSFFSTFVYVEFLGGEWMEISYRMLDNYK